MTPQERHDSARDGNREFLTRIFISEGVSLLVCIGMLWYLGPGRILIAGAVHQVRARLGRRRNHIDSEAAKFAQEISRWDHEQAAPQNRPPGRRGCDCDGG